MSLQRLGQVLLHILAHICRNIRLMMPSLPLPKRQTIKFKREGLYSRLKDVYIPTRDGSELCADIFLPLCTEHGVKVPALLSMCPYGKDVHALEWGLPQTDIYAKMNSKIKPLGPDAALEALDPVVWVRTHQTREYLNDARLTNRRARNLDMLW